MRAESYSDISLENFYQSASNELAAQQCDGCSRRWFPPEFACPSCGADEWQPKWFSPTGHLYCFTRILRPLPESEPGPFWVAVIEQEDGLKFVARLEVGPGAVPIVGDAVAPSAPLEGSTGPRCSLVGTRSAGRTEEMA